jgi:soluble lytic murein transglycosylase
MISMGKKPKRKKRAVLVILLCIVMVAAAVVLGTMWSLYRAYPYNFQAEIKDNAAKYNQDPLFIASVIRTESGWRTNAVSGVGATGLMQLMPKTGEEIAKKNDWIYTNEKLTDPVYNIQLGCWYIDYLNRKFDGDQKIALAAYNAGDNKVREWIAEGRLKEGQLDIPFPETRSFVRKVMDAYEKYKFLYKDR